MKGMNMDKRIINDLQERLQHATQKIQQQSDVIAYQAARFNDQNLQAEEMKQELLILREKLRTQDELLKLELQKNQKLTGELEILREKARQQEFRRQGTVGIWQEPRRWDTVGNKPDEQRHAEQEKEKKKNEFEILVRQQQSQKEQLSVEGGEIRCHKEQSAEREQYVQRRQERLRAAEESNKSKKQLQQELVEWSKNIRDMQRVIKNLYQFKPCRQLCELLVNIRQNVFQNTEEIQEDLGYVLEAFGISEFEPKEKECFDPKCHEQVHSNIQDIRGREIEKIYSPGFEVDGEVIVKAQVSIK